MGTIEISSTRVLCIYGTRLGSVLLINQQNWGGLVITTNSLTNSFNQLTDKGFDHTYVTMSTNYAIVIRGCRPVPPTPGRETKEVWGGQKAW